MREERGEPREGDAMTANKHTQTSFLNTSFIDPTSFNYLSDSFLPCLYGQGSHCIFLFLAKGVFNLFRLRMCSFLFSSPLTAKTDFTENPDAQGLSMRCDLHFNVPGEPNNNHDINQTSSMGQALLKCFIRYAGVGLRLKSGL